MLFPGIGNGKGHESPFLLALQVIWFRYHNKLAQDLSKQFPELSDEELFQTTKRKVVAVFQVVLLVNSWKNLHISSIKFKKIFILGLLPKHPYNSNRPT